MKERTIIINKAPFTYLDEVGDSYVFNASTQQEMIELLKLSTKLLDICGICYCITYGTLLGAVREGSIIKGDDDVDIIVTDEDRLFDSLPFF